jgi:DDE family transposase
MVARKTVCLRRLGATRRGELQAGRFFANPKVTAAKLVEGWSWQTGAVCAGRHILAIQDTTEIKFPTQAQRRRGLGPVKQGNTYGVVVQAMIAVDADSRACLGLVGGDVWTRPGLITTPHRDRPLAARESRRWVNTAAQAKTVLTAAAMVTVVDDREGDIYPKWARVPQPHFHLLTRAMVDRRLAAHEAGSATLFAAAAAFPVAGTRTIALPARQPERAQRTARVAIRFGAVEICRPRDEQDRTLAKTVRLRLVEVRETHPPAGVEPLHWRRLTTHAVADAAKAWQIVAWYQARWSIEQLFRVMKSHGLQIEDSQLASADRLVKLAAVATKAACIDIQLVQERDGRHGLPASSVFSEPEIETLAALSPTLQGNTERQRNPHPPQSLAQASWVIARLGGWNCYGKPPGPITMRHGMQRFSAIHQGHQLQTKWKRDV